MPFTTQFLPMVEYKAGSILLKEGEKSGKVFILEKGGVMISIQGEEIGRVSESGTILGEIGAFLNCPHTATVTVVEPSKFYVIENFTQYLQDNPQNGVELAKLLAQRLYQMNNRFLEFKKTIDNLFDPRASLKEQVNVLIRSIDTILGRSIFGSIEKDKRR